MQWEVFLPERYKVKDFGGDVIASNLVPATFNEGTVSYNYAGGLRNEKQEALFPGQVGGVVTDPSGAVIPNARVTVTHPETGVIMTTVTDEAGRWVISHFPSGQATIKADFPGFRSTVQNFAYDASAPAQDNLMLSVGTTAENVTVEATGAMISTNGRNHTDLAPASIEKPGAGSLRKRSESSAQGCRRTADRDRRASCGNIIQLRAAPGAQRRDEGDIQLQEQVTKAASSRQRNDRARTCALSLDRRGPAVEFKV
jgi:hypothetical protein